MRLLFFPKKKNFPLTFCHGGPGKGFLYGFWFPFELRFGLDLPVWLLPFHWKTVLFCNCYAAQTCGGNFYIRFGAALVTQGSVRAARVPSLSSLSLPLNCCKLTRK